MNNRSFKNHETEIIARRFDSIASQPWRGAAIEVVLTNDPMLQDVVNGFARLPVEKRAIVHSLVAALGDRVNDAS